MQSISCCEFQNHSKAELLNNLDRLPVDLSNADYYSVFLFLRMTPYEWVFCHVIGKFFSEFSRNAFSFVFD